MQKKLKNKKQDVHVIISGKKVTGTRFFLKQEDDSYRQVVEYTGLEYKDPFIYRKNAAPEAILWEARRILAYLYEKTHRK